MASRCPGASSPYRHRTAVSVPQAYALITGQDVVATLLFYTSLLVVAAAAVRLGIGAGAYCGILLLMRPPFMRSVPSCMGPLAFLRNLPSRRGEA